MKPEPATAPHPAAILAIILASYFMILLDNSVIFTALPSLQEDLQLSTGELSWVQNAYTLVFGGLLLLGPGQVTCSDAGGFMCSGWRCSPSRRC